MSEQDAVERVAEAISKASGSFTTWEDCKKQDSMAFRQHVSQCYAYARAAVDAVREALLARTDREPITAYVDCGGTYGYDADVTFEVEAWLRAALGEGTDAD